MSKKRVLLLRSNEDKPDSYKIALKDFEVLQIPILQFEFIHQDELVHKFNTPEKYNAIVFTSVRSVEAVSKIMENGTKLHPSWQTKKCFVVGEITYSKVCDLHYWKASNVVGKETG